MDLKHLHSLIEELKLPAFREKQIRQAFFVGLVSGWEEITVLSKDLREKLAGELDWLSVKEERVSRNEKDGSVKAALKLEDGELIETVLIRHNDGRNTVCVSSQVGCPMGCAFCATGKGGFKRNLEVYEIVDQVMYFAQYLKREVPLIRGMKGVSGKKNNPPYPPYQGGETVKVTNIVFMGMGEPLLNYDNVMEAIRILNDNEYFNLGARHISISTCGIVPGIERLAEEKYQVNLAISLHASTDKLRGKFMPVNKKYGLEEILGAVDDYIAKTNRRVMLEYLLIDGVNDSENEALKLTEILKVRPLCYANLIPYNDTGSFSRSSGANIKKFASILEKNRVKFTIRHSFGGSIDAACGQLAGKK